MKYLDFQKMLKELKAKGMYVGDEMVVIRRDIYDLEMKKVQNFLQAKKATETKIN